MLIAQTVESGKAMMNKIITKKYMELVNDFNIEKEKDFYFLCLNLGINVEKILSMLKIAQEDSLFLEMINSQLH